MIARNTIGIERERGCREVSSQNDRIWRQQPILTIECENAIFFPTFYIGLQAFIQHFLFLVTATTETRITEQQKKHREHKKNRRKIATKFYLYFIWW